MYGEIPGYEKGVTFSSRAIIEPAGENNYPGNAYSQEVYLCILCKSFHQVRTQTKTRAVPHQREALPLFALHVVVRAEGLATAPL